MSLELIEGGKEKCPYCFSYNTDYGYGMAGGGLGTYSFCLDCNGPVFNKVQDGDSEEKGQADG